jgi:hypothetical protein
LGARCKQADVANTAEALEKARADARKEQAEMHEFMTAAIQEKVRSDTTRPGKGPCNMGTCQHLTAQAGLNDIRDGDP